MKVLLIEDAACMYRAFETLLQESGHEVHVCVGCQSLEPLVLTASDGSANALASHSFDVALCDGQLIGSIEGPAIVEQLTRLGIPSFGISTQDSFNQAMQKLGAKGGQNKAIALLLVMAGVLTPELIASDAEFNLGADVVDDCLKNKELRSKADALIMRFLS
ncbi:MAG: response regulator [Candidatus Obscuribacterales bacterium]|jgi:CheY-like chemotaxis protein|nr:response regulator [Candidatus Obscuribacterales bacterium]